MNKTVKFNTGWEFCKANFGQENFTDLCFDPVDIPHDYLIYQCKDLYETSTGWYCKSFYVSEETLTKRVALRFDGVYMDSTIYVNGKQAFEWKYGYTTFECDITKFLKAGENTVTVRVDYQCPNTRWYSGAGIFRDVWYKEYENINIIPDGVYIRTENSGKVKLTVEAVRPADRTVDGLSCGVRILDGGNEVASVCRPVTAAYRESLPDTVYSMYEDSAKFSVNEFELNIKAPKLWSLTERNMYTAEVTLYDGETAIHEECVKFGFREARFDPDKGFFLNGEHIKLHGVCEHHDNGALGAAFNINAFRRKMLRLREMGVNALRTSHNPPAPGVMQVCDELGFIVFSEGFDMWERPKTDHDYGNYFKEWVPKDVCSWVRRDRNHPSLIAWSVGNEIYDTHADEHGQEIISRLRYLVTLHDPDHNGIITHGSNYMQWENARKCTDILKLAGVNYGERFYDEMHEKYPEWTIYGSETASTLQSRSVYHFPYSQAVLADDDRQCSSLGNCSTGWGAKNSEYCIIMDRDRDYCAGQFIWTGFDYIGEPTPYDTKNSYFGQHDTAGYPKDSAYVYRAAWTDKPFVHIFPYWDHSEGAMVDIRAVSNQPAVKIFLNGREIAAGEIDILHGDTYSVDTVIPYEKGEVTAIAYDKDGNETARDTVKSFGDTARIVLTPETDTLKADGQDLIYLDISAGDSEGNFVANANNRVFVEVSGAGRLIGLDNGDSNDYEEYKGVSRRLFGGHLMAIIAAKDIAGDINIKVSSPSLPDEVLTLKALPAEVEDGTAFSEENVRCESDFEVENADNDIPIRRVNFIAETTKFTPDCREITVTAEILPNNATIRQLEYRITNILGIESNLAEIANIDGEKVTVRCKGDGEFYFRALTNNGTPRCRAVYACPMTAEGIGSACFDPYEFVAGGLYDISSGNVHNGIEKGVEFANTDSWFGFDNVDFGSIGSDTVTVPIWANVNDPVGLKIYDGTPENGELLADISWYEKPIWLTYQDAVIKLSKKLKGMHTLTFRSSDRYAIKGFVFEKTVKEWAEIQAVDREMIYGDKFTVGEDAVTGIGNNVVLEFGEFDFTDGKPHVIEICGRSSLPMNSIHVTLSGDTQERVLCEFRQSEEYAVQTFPVDFVQSKGTISFTFLPGTDFDFKSFRFVK